MQVMLVVHLICNKFFIFIKSYNYINFENLPEDYGKVLKVNWTHETPVHMWNVNCETI